MRRFDSKIRLETIRFQKPDWYRRFWIRSKIRLETIRWFVIFWMASRFVYFQPNFRNADNISWEKSSQKRDERLKADTCLVDFCFSFARWWPRCWKYVHDFDVLGVFWSVFLDMQWSESNIVFHDPNYTQPKPFQRTRTPVRGPGFHKGASLFSGNQWLVKTWVLLVDFFSQLFHLIFLRWWQRKGTQGHWGSGKNAKSESLSTPPLFGFA